MVNCFNKNCAVETIFGEVKPPSLKLKSANFVKIRPVEQIRGETNFVPSRAKSPDLCAVVPFKERTRSKFDVEKLPKYGLHCTKYRSRP